MMFLFLLQKSLKNLHSVDEGDGNNKENGMHIL